jgi:CRP/FNR family transcriptional regulator, cyclic AMP receptor protein
MTQLQTSAPAGERAAPLARALAALAANPVLGLLSDDARRRLVAGGSQISLESGRILCQAGDVGDAVYVLLEGEIEVGIRSVGGHDLRLVSHHAGAIVGEMAALDGGTRSADMAAVRRSSLWRIPRAILIQALESEPKAAVALVVELSRRLRASNEALEAARILDLGARVANLLLREAGASGRVQLTQTEIARRVGASREKVNRKLHAFVAQALVRITAAGVVIDAPQRLAQIIETGKRG